MGRASELTADQRADVVRQAAGLGVVQSRLSGGEPLLRRDLTEIVAAADGAGILCLSPSDVVSVQPVRGANEQRAPVHAELTREHVVLCAHRGEQCTGLGGQDLDVVVG